MSILLFLIFIFLLGTAAENFNALNGTSVRTDTAGFTLVVIDLRMIIVKSHRPLGTLLNAQSASYTAVFAHCPCDLSYIPRGTSHRHKR